MNIAIYIYDHAEVLDFSGPFEVLSTAKRMNQLDWNIFFIAESDRLIEARGGMLIKPHYHFLNTPHIDLLIVVGGDHTEELKKNHVIDWIKQTDQETTKTISICTGAFLLAEAGLLNNKEVTTHWEDIDTLTQDYPSLNVIENSRWVDSGKFITSGGISAGIDMSLYLLSTLTSKTIAENTAKQMEYRWQQQSQC